MSGIVGGGKTKSGTTGGGFLGEPHQTWTSVQGDRASGTTYTNTTGSPIFVLAAANLSSGHINVEIDGLSPVYNGGYNNHTICSTLVVPHGSTYKITSSDGVLDDYQELR
jgi:hypothetical protein